MKHIGKDPENQEEVYQFSVNIAQFVNRNASDGIVKEIIKSIIKTVSDKAAEDLQKIINDDQKFLDQIIEKMGEKLASDLLQQVISKIDVQAIANLASIHAGKVIGKLLS